MKKNIERNLALTIVRAQACSDAGKGNFSLYLGGYTNNQLIKRKYQAKDEQILKAINIICRLSSERAGVKFDVVEDKQGVAYYICYFTYYLNGKKRQISFHTFSEKVGKFCRYDSKVRWDHNDSRRNCQELINFFDF